MNKKESPARFNSMIVRLKGLISCVDENNVMRFQFYDSPIKRGPCASWRCRGSKFQFYDSPIKSNKWPNFMKYVCLVSIL